MTITTDTLTITISYNDDSDLTVNAWRGDTAGQPDIDGCAIDGDPLTRGDICGATEYEAEEILAAIESARSEMNWTCKLSGFDIPPEFLIEVRSLRLPDDNWYSGSISSIEKSPYWGCGENLFARIEEPGHPADDGWYPVRAGFMS